MASPVTTEEWAQHLGNQVRRLRVDSQIEQAEVAERASVSRSAVQALENGRGTSIATLIKVLRVLNALDWLGSLYATGNEPSPLELFQAEQVARKPAKPRVRRPESGR